METARPPARLAVTLPSATATNIVHGTITVLTKAPRLPLFEYDARIAIHVKATRDTPGAVIGTVHVLGQAEVRDYDKPTDRLADAPYRIGDMPHEGDMPHQQGGLWLFGNCVGVEPFDPPCLIEDQRLWGTWAHGTRCWLLARPVLSTVACPLCDGTGLGFGDLCPACYGDQACPPVQCKGRTGLWDLRKSIEKWD